MLSCHLFFISFITAPNLPLVTTFFHSTLVASMGTLSSLPALNPCGSTGKWHWQCLYAPPLRCRLPGLSMGNCSSSHSLHKAACDGRVFSLLLLFKPFPLHQIRTWHSCHLILLPLPFSQIHAHLIGFQKILALNSTFFCISDTTNCLGDLAVHSCDLLNILD